MKKFMKVSELKRRFRRFAYNHAPKRVKKARYEAFNKELSNAANWRLEPYPFFKDQPN